MAESVTIKECKAKEKRERESCVNEVLICSATQDLFNLVNDFMSRYTMRGDDPLCIRAMNVLRWSAPLIKEVGRRARSQSKLLIAARGYRQMLRDRILETGDEDGVMAEALHFTEVAIEYAEKNVC